ncbi:hypothetical protein AB0P17_29660 [Streptomyces sp. NPDC088124]|uniref:hypothetical protein n=1 Tax=Streptomyces sp. NPDC088124 TaxID=3154654 RepID=UPI003446E5D1
MRLTTGTQVMLEDPDCGTWRGRVVVCLCKRHTWQPYLRGRECGHAKCGFPRAASECPWPLHVRWDNGNESHQGPESLKKIEKEDT